MNRNMVEINIPIDITSIVWAIIVAMVWMTMREYVEYKTGRTGQSKPQLFESMLKMVIGEIREATIEVLPVWKDYKDKTKDIPIVKDVSQLISDLDIVKSDINKLKDGSEPPTV